MEPEKKTSDGSKLLKTLTILTSKYSEKVEMKSQMKQPIMELKNSKDPGKSEDGSIFILTPYI